jgi:hypothetical protein
MHVNNTHTNGVGVANQTTFWIWSSVLPFHPSFPIKWKHERMDKYKRVNHQKVEKDL